MKVRVYRTGVWKMIFSLLALLAPAGYSSALPAQSVAPHAGSLDLAKIDTFVSAQMKASVSAQMKASHIPGVSLGIVHGT